MLIRVEEFLRFREPFGSKESLIWYSAKINPFIERVFGDIIELVNFDNIILRVQMLNPFPPVKCLLPFTQRQFMPGIHTSKCRLPMIEVDISLAEVEIDDIDRDDLLHLAIIFP